MAVPLRILRHEDSDQTILDDLRREFPDLLRRVERRALDRELGRAVKTRAASLDARETVIRARERVLAELERVAGLPAAVDLRDGWRWDHRARALSYRGQGVGLSQRETDLVAALAARPNVWLLPRALEQVAWGGGPWARNVVAVNCHRVNVKARAVCQRWSARNEHGHGGVIEGSWRDGHRVVTAC